MSIRLKPKMTNRTPYGKTILFLQGHYQSLVLTLYDFYTVQLVLMCLIRAETAFVALQEWNIPLGARLPDILDLDQYVVTSITPAISCALIQTNVVADSMSGGPIY